MILFLCRWPAFSCWEVFSLSLIFFYFYHVSRHRFYLIYCLANSESFSTGGIHIPPLFLQTLNSLPLTFFSSSWAFPLPMTFILPSSMSLKVLKNISQQFFPFWCLLGKIINLVFYLISSFFICIHLVISLPTPSSLFFFIFNTYYSVTVDIQY